MTAGQLAQTLGRRDEAERLLRAALVGAIRCPASGSSILATRCIVAGRYTEAEAMFRRVLAIAPDFVWTRPWLAKTLLAEGKPQEALDYIAAGHRRRIRVAVSPGRSYWRTGARPKHEAAAQRLASEQGAVSAFYVAQYYAYAGDKDRAMLWLERAYAQKDTGLVDIVGEPLLRNLWADPRYRAFMRKMKLPEP